MVLLESWLAGSLLFGTLWALTGWTLGDRVDPEETSESGVLRSPPAAPVPSMWLLSRTRRSVQIGTLDSAT